MDKVKLESKNIITIKFKNMKLNIKLSIFTLFLTKIATACEFQEIADDKISYMGFINADIGWIRFQCPHHQEFSLARCGCFNPQGNSAGGQVFFKKHSYFITDGQY